MRIAATLTLIFIAYAPKAFAHAGAFGFYLFGLPGILSNLVWTAFFTTVAILVLVILGSMAEDRARQASRKERSDQTAG